jgi:hypothetical protein
LAADDPSVGTICPACGKEFQEGDRITLVPLGPGENKTERERALQGRAYKAVAIPVHWACATGEEA